MSCSRCGGSYAESPKTVTQKTLLFELKVFGICKCFELKHLECDENNIFVMEFFF